MLTCFFGEDSQKNSLDAKEIPLQYLTSLAAHRAKVTAIKLVH